MDHVQFDYNTQRPRLAIPEYGRNVQRMVDLCLEMEDRDQRTRAAKGIIQAIVRLNPHLRSIEDHERIVWDHLHIMSDFKLDADSPYPKPTPEELDSKPERVPYPQHEIKYGHYGKMVERMIEQCAAMDAGDKRNAYALLIANLMKRQFLAWNRDTVPDTVILKDLAELSKGKVRLAPEAQLASTESLLSTQRNGPRSEVDPRKARYANQEGSGGGKKRHRKRKKNRY
jgi:hypothetical protein